MISKTFCILPWLNITVDPSGDVKPCCVSSDYIKKSSGEKYNLGADSIHDIYNSKDFLDIRTKMLNGEKVAGCSQCYVHEEYGGASQRIMYNNIWTERKNTTIITDPAIEYFDLRFGNLCNLSCRSCNPTNSSVFAKEIHELKDSGMLKYHEKYELTVNEWYNTDMFDANIKSQLDNISMLYLTGGEPTVIKKNIELLEWCIANKVSDKITLIVNSNMTNLNPLFHSLLHEFKSIIFYASIDGYGDIQEYLRYPSNWKQIDKNIRTLLQSDKIIIRPTPVIQIGNLNKISDLFEYFEEFNREKSRPVVSMMPIILENPSYLNISCLPSDYKKMCWERIQLWLTTKCKYQSPVFHNKMLALKNKCLAHADPDDHINLNKYVEYNNIFDDHRNHHIQTVNPELHNIL